MNREIKGMDFDLLEQCCTALGMELVPAESDEFITLTDKSGNKEKIFPGYNIFDTVYETQAIDVLYNIDYVNYTDCKNTTVTNSRTEDCQYENNAKLTYTTTKNAYPIYENNAA